MNLFGIVLVVYCFAQSIGAAPTPCELQDGKDIVCNETEYEAYRNCIEESRGNREKRQTSPCPLLVHEPIVHTVKPFEVLVPVLPLKAVHRPDLKSLDRTIIVQQGSNQIDDEADDEEGDFHYRLPVNVTTVIKLTNIVNNTNNIHMPTTLNNTNVNNIHIYTNQTDDDADDDGPYAPEENCCTAVRPQSCHTSTQGVHCKRRKFQTCGPQCTAKVVHIQKRKRCNRSTGECQEKIAYVPQPEKPTCVYIEEWPYVVCGKKANMNIICAGCYDHYGRGYEAVHGNAGMQPQCFGCYDDAFDMGPLYRRGPVLRPFYYHQPPCHLTAAGCPTSYDNCGYGCYGHDRIDPAWGHPGTMEQFDPSMDPSNTIYYDPDDLEITDGSGNDWGVPTAKCSVVTDGNTITVKNCSDSSDNPYAAAPVSYPYYNKVLASDKKKHTQKPSLPTETTEGLASSTQGVTHNDTAPATTVPPPTMTTITTQVQDEKEDGQTTVTDSSMTTASTVKPIDKEDYEYAEVEGSAGRPLNNEVSFVEEYVDDEDFIL